MYCRHCGAEMGNETYCPKCGAHAEVPVYDAEVVNNGGASYSGVSCPHCGGHNCQPMQETNISGGGYDPGSGCCGYILFGPLGLLCGLCGNESKTTHNNYWICKDCGCRFGG